MLGMDATCGQRALLTEGPLKAELEHRSFVHLGRLPIDLLAVRQVAVWRARSIQAAVLAGSVGAVANHATVRPRSW